MVNRVSNEDKILTSIKFTAGMNCKLIKVSNFIVTLQSYDEENYGLMLETQTKSYEVVLKLPNMRTHGIIT